MSGKDLEGRRRFIAELRLMRDRSRRGAANRAIANERQEELEKLTALLDDILDCFDPINEAG